MPKHYHFESVEAALRDGVDIIPTMTQIRKWDCHRRVADTERGAQIICEIALLERLIEAYRHNRLGQS